MRHIMYKALYKFHQSNRIMNDKMQYDPPEDVKAVSKTYSVMSKLFTIALLKLRYDKMNTASQIRAEKTMFALLHERNWDAKSDR